MNLAQGIEGELTGTHGGDGFGFTGIRRGGRSVFRWVEAWGLSHGEPYGRLADGLN